MCSTPCRIWTIRRCGVSANKEEPLAETGSSGYSGIEVVSWAGGRGRRLAGDYAGADQSVRRRHRRPTMDPRGPGAVQARVSVRDHDRAWISDAVADSVFEPA